MRVKHRGFALAPDRENYLSMHALNAAFSSASRAMSPIE